MTTALKLQTTRVFEDNMRAWLGPQRRALNEGGTSSSKTYSILQLLILIAQHAKSQFLISIVSESLPHLKKGAIRDFFNILDEGEKNNPNWNMTDHVYRFGQGIIEFFGSDEVGKVRGPRRDILFINEGNNVPWEAARGLDTRTRLFTFVDWNPVSEFWAHQYQSGEQVVPGWLHEHDTAYIHSTYLDAIHVLPRETVEKIESYRDKDPNWWSIYGLGILGKVEGLVYPFFEQVDELPEKGFEFYGLDFGYSTDETALVRNFMRGNELYSKELIYETGLTNSDIANRMIQLGVRRRADKNTDLILADSAEPKSIEEIYRYGFNIKGAPKGPGSVEYGHQLVRGYKQYWTTDSLNGIKEQRNFRYIEDKNGKLTDKTTHRWSHLLDARRYGVTGIIEPVEQEKVVIFDSMKQMGVNMDLV